MVKASFDILDDVPTKKKKAIKLKEKPQKRAKRKLTKATQVLIDCIYKKNGGIVSAAKMIDTPYQVLGLWRSKGFVPLKEVGNACSKFKCSQFALNYEQVVELTRKDVDFKDVVETLELPKEEREHVLALKLPREPKEILK